MEFAILGPLEVRTGTAGRVRLGGDRQERLLAALLLNADGSVPVARLVDAVWDDRPPATADRQVRNLAGMLRRLFDRADPGGPAVLLTDGHGYRISLDGHRLDARTFADRIARARATAADGEPAAAATGLREALALWRGPVLDGLPGQLLAAGSVALDELRLTAWEDCLDLEAALGRHRATVPELTALVADHPLRERFVGQLMRALHRSGRTADALAVHRRFAGRLAEELGLDPSSELQLLHLELLTTGPGRPDGPRPDGGGARGIRGERTDDGAGARTTGARTTGGSGTGGSRTSGHRPAEHGTGGRERHPEATGQEAPGRSTARQERTEPERAGPARTGRGGAGRGSATTVGTGRDGTGHAGPERPAGSVPRPAQLPPPSATFTGREAELATLDGIAGLDRPPAPDGPAGQAGTARRANAGPGPARRARAAPICAVSGSAGVGKSTLVVHWAHRMRDHFPDGQLYADLHGFSPGPPLSPHAVLARFLRALGTSGEHVPTAPEEAAALYRTLLADQRILVVLDNAHSAEQVRPLLPGAPQCLTLVTSRTRLAGLTARDGARPLALGLMPAPDALALLHRVIGDDRTRTEPAAATELATACGHLPLALAITAARLAERPHRTLTDHVTELRDTENRLTALQIDGDTTSAVRTALGLSYHALPTPARTLFRHLALAPTPTFSTAAAAALHGHPIHAVRPLLDQLATAHLLTHENPDHYRMHDLLRLYATERATAETGPAARTAARERLCTWYLHHADAAARLLTPHRRRLPLTTPGAWYESPAFTTATQARQWCESEHTHLLDTVRTAARHGLDDVAWRLPAALWGYYFLSPHLDDWEEAARLAVAAAHRAGDPHGEGRTRNDLATALTALGRHDDSLTELRRARALLASVGDRVGEALVIGNLGDHSLHTGAYGQARVYLQGALALLRAQPADRRDDWAIGACETNVGVSAMRAGRTGEADEYLHRALDRHRSTGNPVLESITLFHLGDHHRRLDRPEQAAERLHQALAVIDGSTGNPRLRAEVLAALADLGERAGRGERADHGTSTGLRRTG
ncbi:BTAD domain-containing putative transcriptional regulator [Kitasatospora sp. NPDC058201]|uniref:AfsR/SARP family transcriptional regulator n=1 Tax=unclassified Kitasatospora TaxID=2633591 RepID=UPI00365C46F7